MASPTEQEPRVLMRSFLLHLQLSMPIENCQAERERKTKTITHDGHLDSHYKICEKIQHLEEWLPSQHVEEFTPKEAETVTS